MKLSILSLFKKKSPFSYFLVLVLRDEKANAVVFEEVEGKIRIVGQDTQFFKTSVEDATDQEILEVLDTAISKAESTLPENIQTHKTIFGVKETWVENDKIKKEYLIKLKKVSDTLELTPIGFLVISQAISRLLQKEEGAPISAIIIEVGKRSVTVSLIRAGKTIETKSSEIHESVPHTVDTLLKHLRQLEILPAKIILFDGEKDLTQEFLNHTWSKSLPFLHLPQIATLPPNFDAKAVLVGAATQMGFEILQEHRKAENSPLHMAKPDLQKPKEGATEKDKDLLKEQLYLKPADFGFSFDTPSLDHGKEKYPYQDYPHIEPKDDLQQQDYLKPTDSKPQSLSIFKSTFLLTLNALKKLKDIKYLTLKTRIPKIFEKRFIIPSVAILVLVSLAFLYLLAFQTEIALTIEPKIIEKKESVIFSTSPITQPLALNIIGETVTVSQQGSVATSATGKKQIGNNASGKVTIFNNHINEVTLVSGTKITSSNNLIFTLDDTTKVASASSDPFEGIKPSKKEANVTAASIGQEYNLPSNATFSVNDDPLMAAKNDNPFSQGSKKDVVVVSEKDIDKLIGDLPKALEDNARERIKEQISKDEVLLPIFIGKSLDNKTFNKKPGEEADSVTLAGTVVFEAISYKKDDIASKARSLINDALSEEQVLLEDNLKIEIKDMKEKNKTIIATLNIKALLQPKIDEQELITMLKGKSFEEAQRLLLKIKQISKAEVYSKPNIFFLPKTISRNPKNVKITIKLDE